MRMIRFLFCALVLLNLSGCGFRPLYGSAAGASGGVAGELAKVSIVEQNTRLGQLIRNNLLSTMSPPGSDGEGVYRLELIIDQAAVNAIEARDTTVKRRTVTVNVGFRLTDQSSGRLLYEGRTFSDVGYDRVSSEFANTQAAANASERAAAEIAADVRTRLAAWFGRHTG